MKIYFEKKPDHYVGDDVTITIRHNTRGSGLAEHIVDEIRKIDRIQSINMGRELDKTERLYCSKCDSMLCNKEDYKGFRLR